MHKSYVARTVAEGGCGFLLYCVPKVNQLSFQGLFSVVF